MLQARNVSLSYGPTPALKGVSLSLEPGRRIALMGPSGCGKSSLLHCLCGVVAPNSGTVVFDGTDLTTLSERARSRIRLERFGVVFQFGDLVPELTLVENVALPLELLGRSRRKARVAAMALLDELGVASVADQRTGAVSGGQAQRAAVARALVHEPAVVLADEPTGSLDTVTAEAVLDAMTTLTERIGAALLVVTHDNVVASHLDELVSMNDGVIDVPAAVVR
jgi:putative ABC transport system ATP-binding protein